MEDTLLKTMPTRGKRVAWVLKAHFNERVLAALRVATKLKIIGPADVDGGSDEGSDDSDDSDDGDMGEGRAGARKRKAPEAYAAGTAGASDKVRRMNEQQQLAAPLQPLKLPGGAGASVAEKPDNKCKCGSSTHRRTNHKDCPLNKR